MTYPSVVPDNRLGGVSSGRIPDERLGNVCDVVIFADEAYILCAEDAILELYVACYDAVVAELNPVPESDVFVRRPDVAVQGNTHKPFSLHIWAEEMEPDEIPKHIGYGSYPEHEDGTARAQISDFLVHNQSD